MLSNKCIATSSKKRSSSNRGTTISSKDATSSDALVASSKDMAHLICFLMQRTLAPDEGLCLLAPQSGTWIHWVKIVKILRLVVINPEHFAHRQEFIPARTC